MNAEKKKMDETVCPLSTRAVGPDRRAERDTKVTHPADEFEYQTRWHEREGTVPNEIEHSPVRTNSSHEQFES